MAEFTMPSLGADMTQGVLVDWYVREGDPVERGQVIAAVDTDKAVIDVEVFHSGVVERLLVEPGTTVPVGTPLAVIDEQATAIRAGEPPTEPPEPRAPSPPPQERREPVEDRVPISGAAPVHHASLVLSPVVRNLADRLRVDTSGLRGTGVGGRVTRADVERAGLERAGAEHAGAAPSAERPRVSPRARRRARERGVDPALLHGTGPAGAVQESDVVGWAPERESAGATPAGVALAGADRAVAIRQAIARTMERSSREIPHFHLTQLADLADLVEFLRRTNEQRPPAERLLPAAAVLRAVALAAREVPELNGHWVDGGFRAADQVDLAIVVALRGGGVINPVLHDADRTGLEELMATMRDLVERARRGGLRASELQGATMTVTNLGDRGVDTVHGLIHPPQVALVGAGRIAERPMVVDGQVVARPSVLLSLAADHRVTDGQRASRLLNRIEAHLQEPGSL